jgi:hypothetical protein
VRGEPSPNQVPRTARRADPDGRRQHGPRPRRRGGHERAGLPARRGLADRHRPAGGRRHAVLRLSVRRHLRDDAHGYRPDLAQGLLNVGGGPIVDIARLSGFRDLLAATLRTSKPSLVNGGPGLDGFTESWPLPHDPPITDPVKGAIAIQRNLSDATWYGRPGGPEPYAPLLRLGPRGDAEGGCCTRWPSATGPFRTSPAATSCARATCST